MRCGAKIGTHTCHLDDCAEPHACVCGLIWPWPNRMYHVETYITFMTTVLGIILLAWLFL